MWRRSRSTVTSGRKVPASSTHRASGAAARMPPASRAQSACWFKIWPLCFGSGATAGRRRDRLDSAHLGRIPCAHCPRGHSAGLRPDRSPDLVRGSVGLIHSGAGAPIRCAPGWIPLPTGGFSIDWPRVPSRGTRLHILSSKSGYTSNGSHPNAIDAKGTPPLLDMTYENARKLYYQMRSIGRVPSWADKDKILQFYMDCPPGYVVKHIIPLFSNKAVCGLHVHNNLSYHYQPSMLPPASPPATSPPTLAAPSKNHLDIEKISSTMVPYQTTLNQQ